jgi:hypothetical protein
LIFVAIMSENVHFITTAARWPINAVPPEIMKHPGADAIWACRVPEIEREMRELQRKVLTLHYRDAMAGASVASVRAIAAQAVAAVEIH